MVGTYCCYVKFRVRLIKFPQNTPHGHECPCLLTQLHNRLNKLGFAGSNKGNTNILLHDQEQRHQNSVNSVKGHY